MKRNACRGENDEQQISQIAQIFKGGALFCSSHYALGIGAASFASFFRERERGMGTGNGNGKWEREMGTGSGEWRAKI